MRIDADSSLRITVPETVYPPSEDSMLLLRGLEVKSGERLLEVGTGSGIVALHAARVARVTATDVNGASVQAARSNATANGIDLALIRCDLFRGIRGSFDVIAFNPPYLEGVPSDDTDRAWFGGARGDEVALRFLRSIPDHVNPKGRVYLLVREEQARLRATLSKSFTVREVGREHLFFETLVLVELSAGRPP